MRRKLIMYPGKVQNCCDPADKMVVRYGRVEIKGIEQLALIFCAPPHHRTAPSMLASH
jgi:hypothetical protein